MTEPGSLGPQLVFSRSGTVVTPPGRGREPSPRPVGLSSSSLVLALMIGERGLHEPRVIGYHSTLWLNIREPLWTSPMARSRTRYGGRCSSYFAPTRPV